MSIRTTPLPVDREINTSVAQESAECVREVMAPVNTTESALRIILDNQTFFDAASAISSAGLTIMKQIMSVGRIVPLYHPDFGQGLKELVTRILERIHSDPKPLDYQWSYD